MEKMHCDHLLTLVCLGKVFGIAALAMHLQCCGAGLQGVGEGIDSLLTTGVIGLSPVSDPNGTAILGALTQNPTAGTPWENPKEGDRGVIASVETSEEGGLSCLAFTSTRESFDGIHLYQGTACETPRGVLLLRSLARL